MAARKFIYRLSFTSEVQRREVAATERLSYYNHIAKRVGSYQHESSLVVLIWPAAAYTFANFFEDIQDMRSNPGLLQQANELQIGDFK